MRAYRASVYNDYYLSGFLLGVTLRENCYSCSYARPERISDITIGDFIGLGKTEPFKYSTNNVSSVFVNTEKGEKLYQEMVEAMSDCTSIERCYMERLEYGPSLRYPFPRHRLNKEFRECYKREQFFPSVIRKVLRIEMIKKGIKHTIGCWTYLYRIPRKLFRTIKQYISRHN